MKIRLISSGHILEVNGSYGARMCEQGKAVAVQDAPKAAVPGQNPPPSQGDGKTRKGKKSGAEG